MSETIRDGWLDQLGDAKAKIQKALESLSDSAERFKEAQDALDEIGRSTPGGMPLLVDVPEAERLLCVSRSALYRLIDGGKLHAVKIFGSTRLRRSEVESFAGTAE